MENAMPIRFDKLVFVKTLKDSGQTEEQAIAFADALDKALEQSQGQLTTTQDLLALKHDLITEMNNAIYKMAGIIIGGIGLLLGMMKLLG